MAPQPALQDQARNPSPAAPAPAQPGDGRSATPEAADVVAPNREGSYTSSTEAPLPYDDGAPPLPDEPAPAADDDGWESRWDYSAGAWYFYNHKTGVSQWENPRVPDATTYTYGSNHPGSTPAVASSSGAPGTSSPPKRKWGGYNPAIHGSYDPNADYAKEASKEEEEAEETAAAAARMPYGADYSATAQFNRFTGKFQQAGQGPELHNDENKSKRQMYAFFDVDAAANSHDGRSLKAERRAKTLSKKQLKEYNEKRKEKKEEKRKAWLRSD
ncbi:hypothetical protein ACJBU6_06406 [Exserohilum turcicum]